MMVLVDAEGTEIFSTTAVAEGDFFVGVKGAGRQWCFGGRSAMHRSFLPCRSFWRRRLLRRRLLRQPLVMDFFRCFFLLSDTFDCWLLFYFLVDMGKGTLLSVLCASPLSNQFDSPLFSTFSF